jgi:simple sugar transport system permease protein
MHLQGKVGNEMEINNQTFKRILTSIAVPLLFIIISAIAIPISGFSGIYIVREVVARISRNSFLVIALLLPVMAGMGINFGMILGAMAGQIGLLLITDWGITGVSGLFVAALIGTPIAILLGYFSGYILNLAKGREMITSMMLGLFIAGIYQFFLLYLCGTIVPIKSANILLSKGYGIKNSLTLNVADSLDDVLRFKIGSIMIPTGTFIVIALICLFITWFRKTKLGQDMRACGQDMSVSSTAGLKVNKIRIQSIVISTVMACYGQIIFLQNIGTMNIYTGADQAALFAAAALLVGGATVSKANVSNAIIGTTILHLLFVVMPAAGAKLTGQAVLGEYLRMFISYAVVATALILHSWKRESEKNMDRENSRRLTTK